MSGKNKTTCPTCEASIPIELGWNALGKIVACPRCSQLFDVAYEESYDAESGEEWGWFYLEKMDA